MPNETGIAYYPSKAQTDSLAIAGIRDPFRKTYSERKPYEYRVETFRREYVRHTWKSNICVSETLSNHLHVCRAYLEID